MPKLIPLDSKEFNSQKDNFSNELSLNDANKMVNKFDTRIRKLVKKTYKDQDGKEFEDSKSVWFDKEVLMAIFDTHKCDGVRIYLGNHLDKLSDGRSTAKSKDKICTILVGTKKETITGEDGKPVLANVDQVNKTDVVALSASGDVIYDFGTTCPTFCDGTKLG